jgi:peptide/nickel transport system permease protein
MVLGRYLLRRAAFALLLVFAASSAALLITRAAPSECDADVALEVETRVACDQRRALGLERPIATQYVEWLSRAARFDFGVSFYYSGRPVADLVRGRALNTAVLAFTALVFATAVGIPLGVYTGIRRSGLGVAAVRSASLLMLSMPPLLASLMLVLLAARTRWLPTGGMVSSNAADLSWWQWMIDVALHVPVPALALAIPFTATLERMQSQAMREAAAAPFVSAARARGVGQMRAMLRHAWPLSLRSILGLYGFMIGTLFSGSFIVELITGWPGLGRLMYDALHARDLYLVAGCAATGALFLAIGMLISDLLLAAADPRTRVGAAA